MVDTLDALLEMESEDAAVAHAAYRWRCLLHQEETSSHPPGGMSHTRHSRDTTTVSCVCLYGIVRAGRGLPLGPKGRAVPGSMHCLIRIVVATFATLLPDGPRSCPHNKRPNFVSCLSM